MFQVAGLQPIATPVALHYVLLPLHSQNQAKATGIGATEMAGPVLPRDAGHGLYLIGIFGQPGALKQINGDICRPL